MQKDFDQNYPQLDIQILGVNAVGHESQNALVSSLADIPWLQDVDPNGDLESGVWDEWQVAYRDVVILDKENVSVEIFNLSSNDLGDPNNNYGNYRTLRQMFVSAATGADFDLNGEVNGADFLAWQRGDSPYPLSQADLAIWEENYGHASDGLDPGDFNEDGYVDGADFLEWQLDPNVGALSDWEANYGIVASLSAVSAAVPEPTTCVLALAALCLVMGRRRIAAR